MNESAITTEISSDIDNLTWDDDWTPAAICAIENGADCAACEG